MNLGGGDMHAGRVRGLSHASPLPRSGLAPYCSMDGTTTVMVVIISIVVIGCSSFLLLTVSGMLQLKNRFTTHYIVEMTETTCP